MKKELSTHEAAEILFNDINANWSRAGAFALIEHLEEMEEACDTEIYFDPVAFRCDYSQFSSLYTWADGYFSGDAWMREMGVEDDADEEEQNSAIREYITDHGELIEFEGGIIVSSF